MVSRIGLQVLSGEFLEPVYVGAWVLRVGFVLGLQWLECRVMEVLMVSGYTE